VKCGKGQVAALAEHMERVLADLPALGATALIDTNLHSPLEPRFVLGTIGLAYDSVADRIVIVLEELVVTDEDETSPLQFKLRPTAVGPGQVRVMAFQNGQYRGAITLSPTVVPAMQQPDSQRSRQEEKLSAISVPEMENVHCLCRDSATNQGTAESVEATDAPSPASTSSEGRAQHNRVPTDVNKEK